MHSVKVLTLVLGAEESIDSKEKIYSEYLEPLYPLFSSNAADVKKYKALPESCGAGPPGLQDYGSYDVPTLDAAQTNTDTGRQGRPWFLTEAEWMVESSNAGSVFTKSSSR